MRLLTVSRYSNAIRAHYRYYSSKKTKYNVNLYKTSSSSKIKSSKKQKKANNNNDLYEAPSLSEYSKDINPKGWNLTFYQCHNLQQNSPAAIAKMMNIFNFSVTCIGVGSFGVIYLLSYSTIYSFPCSWLFSWIFIRCFSDLFPLFPKLTARMIESFAFTSFPILKQLKFSRRLPNPETQSVSAMVKERMIEKQQMLKNKGKKIKNEIEDIEDLHFTDEQISKQSVLANWKIRQRAGAKQYGLSWDLAENASTLIMLPSMMCLLQVIGISDPLMNALYQNKDEFIFAFLAANQWIIEVGTSYAVATYLTRIASIPLFKFWCVPRIYEKFGRQL